MEKEILKKIKKYQTIIIYRHIRPDGDALGSQFGLKEALKLKFPTKNIYAVGDSSPSLNTFIMDDIDPVVYNEALVIIVDTAVTSMVSDELYKTAKEVIIIDHHNNKSDIYASCIYSKPQYVSACEVVLTLLLKWKFKLNREIAYYLLLGTVSDSGRFLYVNPKSAKTTFKLASILCEYEPDIRQIYDLLYTDSLQRRQAASIFSKFELTSNFVAYRKNTQEMIDKSGLDFQSVSRGMVNNMAGIKEVPIWAQFTYQKETTKVIAELRSRKIIIVDIAKKYGGGGHDYACGATLSSFEEADLMINDLNERAKENDTQADIQ